MSKNKTWIRIFHISETQDHPSQSSASQSYTIYKVSCTTFPLNSPDDANTVTTWKRFSQFQQLYKQLSAVHKQLYLHGQFPENIPIKYFNRKQPEIIEQRREWSLQLLEFIASQPILNSHPIFINFLFDTPNPGPLLGVSREVADVQPLGGLGDLDQDKPDLDQEVRNKCSSPDLADLEVVISPSISIDTTPVLSPEVLNSESTSTLNLTPNTETTSETISNKESTIMEDTEQKISEDNLANIVNELSELNTGESDVGVMPEYIRVAAEHVSNALQHEADDDIEKSLAEYRAAIGGLLTNVQADPDTGRQAQVKRRIAQYISKAEQLVKREAEFKNKRVTKIQSGIPHLQLFGQLSELKKFKVKNILANKLIVAESLKSGELAVFKTLHKSPAVYKKSKTSLLPINITFMVKLLKYFETDDCVYLMLEYCAYGLLWDVVQPLVGQSRDLQAPNPSTESNIKKQVQHQTSIIKPSESFIHDRKISINLHDSEQKDCDVTNDCDNDADDDLLIVHQANSNSVVVVNNDKIEHFENINDEGEKDGIRLACDSNIVKNSQIMIEQISAKIDKNDEGVKNVLDKLDHIESKIKRHLDDDPIKENSTKSVARENVSTPTCTNKTPVLAKHPRVLRKLSEILPQCSNFLDAECGDMTWLPDKLIRTWAAQLCQVLTSLHYREVIIKDLNPGNILLDSCGHVRLTYQCQWVSVDTCLAREALLGNYCSPEVVGVGAPSEITPAADWWSFGAILHLLYSGVSPSAVIPSGVDNTIPLQLSDQVSSEVQLFISQLLQPQPEYRLGAGSRGSHDVRSHPFFNGWNWSSMSWD